MDTSDIHIRLTVHELLQRWPQAFSVFMNYKTKCPGCFLQQFCTLEDVAEIYQISPENLVAEIKHAASRKNQRSI